MATERLPMIALLTEMQRRIEAERRLDPEAYAPCGPALDRLISEIVEATAAAARPNAPRSPPPRGAR